MTDEQAMDERARAELWRAQRGDGPLVATAIHDGHEVRAEVHRALSISDADRLREEDPYTGAWASLGDSWIVARRSRFEVDLNRPPERAVYRSPEDAWGLEVWKREPSQDVVERSLAQHRAFYREMRGLLEELVARHGRAVVLDLHSYNHRRSADRRAADPDANPEVNVGTGTMERARWAPLVDRFMEELRGFDFLGRRLDVRENVKFRGGQLPRFVHETFPGSVCALAVEFKKFFMDEWSGELFPEEHGAIRAALGATLPGLREELGRCRGPSATRASAG